MLWHRIAIDLGTTYSLVYTQEKGIVLREPSAVAIKRATGEAIAFGERARVMLGRAPEFIEVIRPLSDGVIANFDAARALLHYFISEASRGRYLSRKAVLICVPHGATVCSGRRGAAFCSGRHGVALPRGGAFIVVRIVAAGLVVIVAGSVDARIVAAGLVATVAGSVVVRICAVCLSNLVMIAPELIQAVVFAIRGCEIP
jgi:rod shape-determining protein MreB